MFYMIFEATNSNELLHYEQLIDFYLKYGSVEAAFYKEREKIFISIVPDHNRRTPERFHTGTRGKH